MCRPVSASESQVGRYRILGELGRGGMGRVLLGAGPDGRLVAVKLVHGWLVGLPGFRERFRREVAATRVVSGAYTAAVLDADADAPTPWLASVYVPAPSLTEAAPLPEEAVLRLAAGLAGALVEIHGAGLVHADLKPSNVLLSAEGPKVIDFGVARAAEESDEQADGPVVGTPGYMSPEQAEGRVPTPASDVFALGSVLAMACTGRGPFDGPGTPQTLYNVVHAEPDLTSLPNAVRPIVAACLAKDPDARPAPGRLLEMIGRIAPAARPWPGPVQRLIEQRGAEAARLLSPGTAATRVDRTVVDRPPRAVPRRWLAMGGAGAACAVLAAAVVVWSPWSGSAAKTGVRPTASTVAKSTPPPVSYELRGHTDIVKAVAFSPDGKSLVTASSDHTARVWDVATHTQRGKPFQHPKGVNVVAVTPDGSGFYTGDGDGRLNIWPMSGHGRTSGFEAATGGVGAMALSTHGGIMATDDNTYVRLWALSKGKVGPAFAVQSGVVETLAFSPDSHLLAVGTTGAKRNLDTSNTEGVVELWDLSKGKKVADLTGYKGWVESVAFSPDGKTLAAAGDEITRLWDVATHKETSQPITCDGRCYSIAYSPDGKTLATGGSGGVAQLWNLADHRQIGPPLAGHTGVIFSLKFSPDGRMLATGSGDNTARLWPVPAAR
jgi:hypothetical protein